MDLNGLQPAVSKADRHGYIYHTVFKRPTDGKVFHYVGQHRGKNVDRNYYGSGTRLRAMVEKYGLWNNTKVFILGWESSQAELNASEIWLIRQAMKLYGKDCVNLCYREAHGRHTAKLRAWMSEFHKGKVITAEHRAKLTARHRSTPQRILDERNARRSAATKGVPKTAEHVAKISAALMGHKLSEETKRKISLKAKGRKRSQESIAKQSASARGKKRPRVACPHCDKVGGQALMKRWHFDNCPQA